MRKLLFSCVGVVAAMAFWAVPAFADNTAHPGPDSGYIEICKSASTSMGLTAGHNFSYTVTDAGGSQNVLVVAGFCSTAIPVTGTAGSDGTFDVTVQENTQPWFSIGSLSYTTTWNGVTTNVPSLDNPVTVPVMTASDTSMDTKVFYGNVLNTGLLEICKQPQPGSGLTSGTFTFEVKAGLNPNDTPNSYAYDQMITVGLNQCSGPLTVPAGPVWIDEQGTGTFVTNVTVSQGGSPADFGQTSASGIQTSTVVSSNPADETVATFFDTLSELKICKAAAEGFAGTSGTFHVNGGAGVTIPVGSCSDIGAVVPGSTITITEDRQLGSWISAANNNGSDLSGAPSDLSNNTVQFSAVNGLNLVTITNAPAPTVPLKICKTFVAGTTGAAGTTWTFSISANGGAATTQSVTIPADGSEACTLFTSYPYGSSVTVSESGTGFDFVSAAAGGTATLVGTPANGSATVMLGTYMANPQGPGVLTFTNGPHAAAPAAPSGGSSTGGGGSSGGGGGSSSSAPPASNAAPTSTSNASSYTPTPSVVGSHKVVIQLVTARFVMVGHGKHATRWLGITLKGNQKTAKVNIALVGKNGKVIGHVLRTVKTGHFVRVLKIGTHVKSVRVSPLSL